MNNINLLLLPHAGGSAKGYCVMKRFFPPEINLVPLDPSGKGLRSKEPPCTDIPSCVSDIISHNKEIFSQPYAVFGHSMGTVLAMELVRQVKENGFPEPEHLFISGRCTPDEKDSFPVSHENSDDEIISFFSCNGLIPEQVVKNKPLFNMFTEILCRDIRMIQKYTISPEQCTADCDITVMYGKDDIFLKDYDMADWIRFTHGKCKVVAFEGGHFYYTAQQEKFCKCILEHINTES